MEKGVEVLGEVVVKDYGDLGDVQTSGGNVGCDLDTLFGGAECLELLETLFLLLVGVQIHGFD